MKSVNPYLNLPGNTEEAFRFYRSVFGGEFQDVIRFGDFGGNPMGIPEGELDKMAHMSLPLGGGSILMATDVVSTWPAPTFGTSFYIALEVETDEEAERLFAGLSEGGTKEMELQRTEWAEKYGTCRDRFGVQWMVSYTGDVQFPPAPAS